MFLDISDLFYITLLFFVVWLCIEYFDGLGGGGGGQRLAVPAR